MTDRLLVLYDGDCGICLVAATRLRAWDRHDRLELLALQAAGTDVRSLVRDVAAGHPLHDELHVLDPATGTVASGSRALVEIVRRLPGGRLPAALARIPPAAWVIGLGYALVARNRRAISCALRLDTVCDVPGARPPPAPARGQAGEGASASSREWRLAAWRPTTRSPRSRP